MAIAYDNATANTGSGTSASFSHTTSGSDRYLVVVVHTDDASVAPSSVMYGGQAMTLKDSQAYVTATILGTFVYELVNPPLGANTVAVTLGITAGFAISAVSYTGVHQTTPSGAASKAQANNAAPSVTVAAAVGDIVVGGLTYEDSVTTNLGAGQTQRLHALFSGGSFEYFVSDEPGAASVTHSYDFATISHRWALVAFPIKPSTVGGGNPPIDSFSDNFNDGVDDPEWSDSADGTATITEQNGRTEIALGAVGDYATRSTTTPRDLTGRRVFIEIPQYISQEQGNEQYFGVQIDSNNSAYITVENGTVYCRRNVGGTNTAPYIEPYNATNHKWIAIRETGGTTYWERSSDGKNWNTMFSQANPIAVTGLVAFFGLGSWDAIVGPVTVGYFDNYLIAGFEGNTQIGFGFGSWTPQPLS